jgi:hypothetical protein
MSETAPESALTDQTILCRDCGEPFVFTAREAEFFRTLGFTPPRRCRPCRDVRKAERQHAE